MPELKHWVGKKTVLTVGEHTYRGEVIRELFQSARDRATSFYSPKSYEHGYALRTEGGELIRVFMSRYPRVVAHNGGLVEVNNPSERRQILGH